MSIEFRHLRYFVSVAEYRSVAEAARRLHIAQPALSRQIKDLEEVVGAALFSRSVKGVTLTTAGEQFVIDARRLLQDLTSARDRVSMIAKGQTGTLRIGISPGYSWHPAILSRVHQYRRRFPEVSVIIEPALAAPQLDRIADGRLDGGFLAWRDPLDVTFAAQELFECRLKLAMPRKSDLALPVPARLADLKDAPCVWFNREVAPRYHDFLIHQCQMAGFSPNIVQLGGDVSTILGLVAAGMGYSIVPEASIHSCPSEAVLLDHPDLTMSYPVEFVWRRGASHPGLHRFIECLTFDDEARVASNSVFRTSVPHRDA